jgi:hypothetical protein
VSWLTPAKRLIELLHEVKEAIGQRLLLKVAVHCAKLLSELVSDRRGGTRV